MFDLPKINSHFDLYVVGGWVRDAIMGIPSKDLDLCMVAPSFEDMENEVIRLGGEIFVSKPEYLTIRCKLPNLGAVDVAMARSDGEYGDGRRPDSTEVVDNILVDLSRRDCRFNAMAINLKTGELVDPFNGKIDIDLKIVRSVGSAKTRISEDYLRLLRFFRFGITKNFLWGEEIRNCLNDEILIINMLQTVSFERIREELFKCFKHNTLDTLVKMSYFPNLYQIFEESDIWLKPTNEK